MEKVLALVLCCGLLGADFKVQSLAELQSSGLVRQSYEESCGASALATLINLLFNQNFSENDFLEFLENNTGMVSFNHLRTIAEKLGYVARSYQLNRDLFEKIFVPILVKIEDDPRYPHFVVVLNRAGDFVTIFDPNFEIYQSLKVNFIVSGISSNKGALR